MMDILNEVTVELDPVADAYDQIAHRYDSAFHTRRCQMEDRLLTRRLHNFLREIDIYGQVLDVGCGTGAFLRLTDWPLDRYTGIDVSAGMLAQARYHHPDADFQQTSIERLTADRRFAAVVSIFCALSYVNSPLFALDTIYRALVPGGRVFLMVFAPRWYRRNTETGGMLHLQLAPAAWSCWQAERRLRISGFDASSIRLTAFSVLPTPLIPLEGPLARLLPQRGRYLILEARRAAA